MQNTVKQYFASNINWYSLLTIPKWSCWSILPVLDAKYFIKVLWIKVVFDFHLVSLDDSNLWYIYTVEYYSATKKNAFESVLMRWMKLESIIQSEVSQKEKEQYSVLMHIYGV